MYYAYVKFSQIDMLEMKNVTTIKLLNIENDSLETYTIEDFVSKGINIYNRNAIVLCKDAVFYLNSDYIYFKIYKSNL